MSKETLFSRYQIVDGFYHPAGFLSVLVSLAATLFLIDALLWVALSERRSHPDIPLASADDVRQQLSYATQSEGEPWLLLGDSVLAGDVLASRRDDWKDRRVLDFLRKEKSIDDPSEYFQVALNGLLPADMDRIVAELDRRDPQGRVNLMIEMNLRYFSKEYVEQSTCTREWLDDLAPDPLPNGRWNPAEWARQMLAETGGTISDRLPVYRHRNLLFGEWKPSILASRLVVPERTPREASRSRLEGRARILEHYSESEMGPSSAQIQALESLVQRFRKKGRRAVFFMTPMNLDFIRRAKKPVEYGRVVARLSNILESDRENDISLVNLDGPRFVAPYFVDHCHLLPDGNQLLATNLLYETGGRLAATPSPRDLVHPNRSAEPVVWANAPGYCDGPGWAARFLGPGDMAVGPGRRVAIADTGNHCIREVSPNRETVLTTAGAPDRKGGLDGVASEASLDRPASLCFHGNTLFFSDAQGKRLRRLEHNCVTTEYTLDGPSWSDIRSVRSTPRGVYLLEGKQHVLFYDPVGHTTRVVFRTEADETIRAIAVDSSDRLFVADGRNGIWSLDNASDPRGPERASGANVVFANEGNLTHPAKGGHYPIPFEEARLPDILDIAYVERYDALLVQTDIGFPFGDEKNLCMRWLALDESAVYPWIDAAVYGEYEVERRGRSSKKTENGKSAPWEYEFVSQFRPGTMAIHPESSSIYYLERDRSHLVLYGDPVWDLAKVCNIYGWHNLSTRNNAFLNMRPDLYLHRSLERRALEGPYVAMLFSSSMLATSSSARHYSFGRRLEKELQNRFDCREGVRFELVADSMPGMRINEAIGRMTSALAIGYRPDILLLSMVHSPGGFSLLRDREDRYRYFDLLQSLKKEYEVEIGFVNTVSLWGVYSNERPPVDPDLELFLEEATQMGFPVFDNNSNLTRDVTENWSWSASPSFGNHGTAWTIDAAAENLANILFPSLRRLFRDRIPAIFEQKKPVREEVDPALLLRTAAKRSKIPDEVEFDIPLDEKAIQIEAGDRDLTVYADLGRIAAYRESMSEGEIKRIAWTIAKKILVREIVARRATSMTLTMALFENYDEYGLGALEGATIVYEATLDRDSFQRLGAEAETSTTVP